MITTASAGAWGTSSDRRVLDALADVLASGTPVSASAAQCYPSGSSTVLLDLATAPAGMGPAGVPDPGVHLLVLGVSGDCPQIRSSAGAVFTADRARLDPLLQALFASS